MEETIEETTEDTRHTMISIVTNSIMYEYTLEQLRELAYDKIYDDIKKEYQHITGGRESKGDFILDFDNNRAYKEIT
jgi:hypothetical protein